MTANIISASARLLRTILCGACIYVLAVALAFAIDDATLAIERIVGDGWIAKGISIRLDTSAEPLRADIAIAQIAFPKLKAQLDRAHIHCSVVEVSDEAYVCAEATLAAAFWDLGDQRLLAQLRYDRRSGAINARLKNVRIGEGTATLNIKVQGDRALVESELSGVSTSQIAKLAKRFGFAFPLEITSGTAGGRLRVESRGMGSHTATLNLTLEQLSVNNAAGSIATDKLQATIEGQLNASDSGMSFRGHIGSGAGQVYFDPVFLDTAAHAIDVQAQGEWRSANGLRVDRFVVRHAGVLTASGAGRLDFNAAQPIRELTVANAQLSFPGVYEAYVQGFVANDALKSLRTSGAATLSAEVSEGVPKSLQIDVQSLSADGESLVRIDGLQGSMDWDARELQRNESSRGSALRWSGASLYGLEIGSGQLLFQLGGHSFRLLEPTHIPLLDGALDLETLRIRNFGEPNISFLIDATVQPVSMPRLCRAFGWPQFGGHIGGAISKLRMRDGVITLGTTLNGQVFNGAVAVRNLRLEKPFSSWPRLYADVGFEGLDLQQVTSAFSFGRITGRLSGTLNGLELFNWSPVAFDARFFTPSNDRTKHRISQRAVESIGSLGGGGSSITAALSSGFLRFFADFNYDRIGLSCRLENDVCVMDGVAPAPNGGYYLVKGWGVPRIDVIGNSRRVDWPRLVQQLKAATEADTVVVK